MAKKRILNVNESSITVIHQKESDYISLTDMASSFREGSGLIGKWITNKNTLEYLGVWEKINNPDFNYPEFGVIGQEAGTNRFIMSVGQWINRTKSIGMLVKAGRYGGTFANKDIAFHFAMWLSPEFQIYLVNEFQRLKEDENNRLKDEWNLQRILAKVNYQIHTDAIKENLIPREITKQQINIVYANEADLLNVALFGITAKEWREKNLDKKGNVRDYATLEQLVVLSNMESINALLIGQGLSQGNRLIELNKVAITQMKSLLESKAIKKLI
ncbi:KilA-N domain-containing protein [uncultured Fluviicola sp.]|uniref:KilA-N domain-containing protein n=1 Tax=uncultured Fluviicola sp. TaxID=463303 RepID=UPI0025E35433|nr:KilA-N domain-containing protein [uncultured Fluviicola sp.]